MKTKYAFLDLILKNIHVKVQYIIEQTLPLELPKHLTRAVSKIITKIK